MTRDQWIAYHLARAPQITPRQWAETLLLLESAGHGVEPENETEQEKSG
jgi:hypothetical protein